MFLGGPKGTIGKERVNKKDADEIPNRIKSYRAF